MRNPFKIYKPVKELIRDIEENPSKYDIYFCYDGEYASCTLVSDENWRIAVSPYDFLGLMWANDNFKWSTLAERRYLFKNLRRICKSLDKVSEHETREGWIKKLGLEE